VRTQTKRLVLEKEFRMISQQTHTGPRRGPARRIVGNVAMAAAATIALVACSLERPAVDNSSPESAAASPSLAEDVVAIGPGTGRGTFAGSVPEMSVTYTMPAGWQAEDAFVLRTGADPAFGLAFYDVGNIYADGCQWAVMDPPVGPSVDHLVAAYTTLPGFGSDVRDVTIDGFTGRQVQVTVPDYAEAECRDGLFGILRHDYHYPDGGDAPSLWAQAPEQVNKMWILDVDGTRLQILASYPPGISEQDRSDLDQMIGTIEIG
jgi:hypothetical protein